MAGPIQDTLPFKLAMVRTFTMLAERFASNETAAMYWTVVYRLQEEIGQELDKRKK